MTSRPLTRALLLSLGGLAASGCAESVRPALGGLKIGPTFGSSFVVPALLNDQLPFEYPSDAWKRGVGGQTTLRIHITSSGTIDSVLVARSSGDHVLDSASVAGVRLLQYRPARRGESPVAVWAYLPVRYPMPRPAEAENGTPR